MNATHCFRRYDPLRLPVLHRPCPSSLIAADFPGSAATLCCQTSQLLFWCNKVCVKLRMLSCEAEGALLFARRKGRGSLLESQKAHYGCVVNGSCFVNCSCKQAINMQKNVVGKRDSFERE